MEQYRLMMRGINKTYGSAIYAAEHSLWRAPGG